MRCRVRSGVCESKVQREWTECEQLVCISRLLARLPIPSFFHTPLPSTSRMRVQQSLPTRLSVLDLFFLPATMSITLPALSALPALP